MAKPNTFIIGAPKCGTTSLAAWLAEHPQVFMSDPKEPSFFNESSIQDHLASDIRTSSTYAKLFAEATDAHLVVGEASTLYLQDVGALQKIAQFNDRARIVVMLRNPAEMAISLHNHHVRYLVDDIRSFSVAWEKIAQRRTGLDIPAGCRAPLMLDYESLCRLGSQLVHVYELFPKGSIYPIFLDDLKRNPRQVWMELQSFLAIDDDARETFPAENIGFRPKRISIYSWMLKTSASLKRRLGVQRSTGLVAGALVVFGGKKAVPAVSAELFDELLDVFGPEIELLERLTGRDLSPWKIGKGLDEA